MNNVAIPARLGSWLAGQNQFAIFNEPDASQLELDGKAHFLASIGETVGPADYTSFMATDKYIRDNPGSFRAGPTRSTRRMKWTSPRRRRRSPRPSSRSSRVLIRRRLPPPPTDTAG